MKMIFVSQSQKDLGRNRHQRRLEAHLDGLSKQPEMNLSFCDYISICPLNKTKRCLFNDKECRGHRFYKRYPEYSGIFIRSKI